MNRTALGIIAALLAAVGGALMFREATFFTGGVFLRAGIMLGALWLVLPNAQRVPRAVWIGLAVAGGVFVLRPRLILLGLGAGLVVTVLAALGGFKRAPKNSRQRPKA